MVYFSCFTVISFNLNESVACLRHIIYFIVYSYYFSSRSGGDLCNQFICEHFAQVVELKIILSHMAHLLLRLDLQP